MAISEVETARLLLRRWQHGDLERLVDLFARRRPRYRTAILSNAAAGGRREEQARYGFEAITDLEACLTDSTG